MKHEKSCGCIIIEDNKVLLIQQMKGHWGFPKGHVEGNETEEETAMREVKEETNIEVKIQKDYRYTETYLADKDIEKEVVYFIAEKTGGEIKPQEAEVRDIKWFHFQEALETITYEDTKKIFQTALQDKKLI